MVTHTRTPLRVDRLRALNLPRPIRVELDDQRRPKTIEDDSAAPAAPAAPGDEGRWRTLGVRRKVEEIIEVWRIDDEWWRAPISRRYVEVVLEGGGHVVLFEDLATGSWFLQMP